jgi:hypothetical protein
VRTHDVGDTVAVDLDLLSGGHKQRSSGKVIEVHADGQITAEFPQDGQLPMTVSGPAGHFIPVRTSTCRALLAEVERLRAELDAIGGMQVIEHEGIRMPVITSALHDRLCKWRVATPQGTEPEVLGCAGCGFCYPPVTVTRPSLSQGGDAR